MGRIREALDTQGLREIVAQQADCLGDALQVRVGHGLLAQFRAVRSAQQPIVELAHERRIQDRDRLWRVREFDHAHDAVGERPIDIGDEHASPGTCRRHGRDLKVPQHLAHDPNVELYRNADKRLFRAGDHDPAAGGKIDADHQALHRTVTEHILADEELLGPLQRDAERRPIHVMIVHPVIGSDHVDADVRHREIPFAAAMRVHEATYRCE